MDRAGGVVRGFLRVLRGRPGWRKNPGVKIPPRVKRKDMPQQQPPQGTPRPATVAPPPTRTALPPGAPGTAPPLFLENASLVEVVDILARALKINYIIDPRVKGSVTINAYGEFKPARVRPLPDANL